MHVSNSSNIMKTEILSLYCQTSRLNLWCVSDILKCLLFQYHMIYSTMEIENCFDVNLTCFSVELSPVRLFEESEIGNSKLKSNFSEGYLLHLITHTYYICRTIQQK